MVTNPEDFRRKKKYRKKEKRTKPIIQNLFSATELTSSLLVKG